MTVADLMLLDMPLDVHVLAGDEGGLSNPIDAVELHSPETDAGDWDSTFKPWVYVGPA
ncbi:MAG: hypothetical protein ACYDAG_13620 [Chloroflexota bacterium]